MDRDAEARLGPVWAEWTAHLIDAVEPLGAMVAVYPGCVSGFARRHGFVVEIALDKTGQRRRWFIAGDIADGPDSAYFVDRPGHVGPPFDLDLIAAKVREWIRE